MDRLPKKEYLELISQIKLEALDLQLEESIYAYCPACGGGPEKKRNFSVTRTYDGILYHCFRDSCGIRGFYSSTKQTYQEKRKKPFKPKTLTRPLRGLSERLTKWLTDTYHLDKELIALHGWSHDYQANRLAIPIYSIDGERVAWSCKSLERANTPKSIEYWEKESPKLNVPLIEHRGAKTLLVEDSISSLRVLPFINSVALLGTHMTYETAFLLSKIAPRVVVALDADTWDKKRGGTPTGIQLRNKFHLMFESFEVLRITKDPKDMNDEELIEEILSKI